MICFFALSSFAQKNTGNNLSKSIVADSKQYKQLKLSGELNDLISSGTTVLNPVNQFTTKNLNAGNQPINKSSSSCYGYTPPNPGATSLFANVDDQGFGPIALPFNFCFYGVTYNACYINSNGNVTFTQAYTTFTASGFPSAAIPPMLAPFWGDVDFGNGNGLAYYEILPNAAIFHWVGAGYFNAHGDKLNTFQLIITDFTSPLLQPGSNVGFFYDNMDWTTGDASLGVGGFGGTPATVGVNEGNGIDYIQIGRFDGPGNSYDGPFNQNDSVDWLDNKTFMFDVCNSVNLPPIVAGIDFCDTLRLCVGDTLPIDVTFLAPEANQTIWCSVDTTLASGFQIVNNTSGSGASCQLNSTFIGSMSNAGVNIVTYMAYDNGVPSDTIQFDYIIVVDTISLFPVIVGDTSYCQGGNVVLDGGIGFDSYLWSSGGVNQTTTVTQGDYTLQASLGGCTVTTDTFSIIEFVNPSVLITGDTLHCDGDSVLLNATLGYDSYIWSTGVNDTLDSVYVTQGNYTVTVTDSNTCIGSSTVFDVYNFSNSVSILGDTLYCVEDSVLLSAGAGFDSYIWSTGVNDTLDSVYVTQGTHFVTVSSFGCIAVDSHTVSIIPVPIPIITGDTAYCAGSGALLNAGPGFDSYLWNSSPSRSTQIVSLTQFGSFTVTVTLNGCSATSLPFTVVENPLPTPIITGDLNYCLNDSLGTILSTLNSYSQYSWSSGPTTSSILADASLPSYFVIVTDSNGCAGVSPSVVVTNSAPVNNISGKMSFCEGEEITINADPGFPSYTWSNNEITPSITVGEGTYSVTVMDAIGCTDTDTVVLVADSKPVAVFTVSPLDHGKTEEIVTFTDQSTLSNGAIIGWNWIYDFNSIGISAPGFGFTQGPNDVIYSAQGTYVVWLEVEADNGCKDTAYLNYLVIDDIIVPNVFTPNGDGLNDFLVFENLEYQPSSHLIVFDRWGKNILETDNYANNWDGDGHASGTYFFILTVPEIEPMKGSFTILR